MSAGFMAPAGLLCCFAVRGFSLRYTQCHLYGDVIVVLTRLNAIALPNLAFHEVEGGSLV